MMGSGQLAVSGWYVHGCMVRLLASISSPDLPHGDQILVFLNARASARWSVSRHTSPTLSVVSPSSPELLAVLLHDRW